MIYDQYVELKKKFVNFVILIKVGNFYHIYDKDAIIVNYLLKYKVIDNRVGFPANALNKVLKNFQKNKINYYVNEDVFQEFGDNSYQQILEKSSLYYELSLDIEEICNYLNDNIERKFIKKLIKKIKDVIDEG